jgi:dienelactone hydrolase
MGTAARLLAAMIPLLLAGCGGEAQLAADGGTDGDVDGDADADTDADGDTDTDSGTGEPEPGAPLFDESGVYATVIAASGDPADVYYPSPPDLAEGGYSFPLAILFQGANVDKQYYFGFAALVARYGFVVVVSNHTSTGLAGTGLFAEQSESRDVIDHMIAENAGSTSPVSGAVDTATVVLLGHSYGGVCALNTIREVCEPPSCYGTFERPEEIAGGAFWGTNLALPIIGTTVQSIANHGLPVALVQGTLDSKAKPEDTQEAYLKLEDPPKAYVGVIGANHYGQCDVDNPPGAAADGTPPTLDQVVAVETVARWSAMFLRAHVLGDEAAFEYIHVTGGPADANVNVNVVAE